MSSQPPERLAWFDVDDTLCFTSAFIERSLHHFGAQSIPSWRSWRHPHFTVASGFPPEDVPALRKTWIRDGLIENAELIPGAREALEAFRDKGYSVRLLTARSWHPDAKSLTLEWARTHHLPVDDALIVDFHESKAEALARTRLSAHFFADDSPKHALEFHNAGVSSALIDAPWNQDAPDGPSRIASIAMAPSLISSSGHKPRALGF